MISLPNNRRKYYQPVVKDVTGVWAPFDMAKSKHVASAQLTDDTASSNPGTIICSTIKPLPDGNLLIGASKNASVYVWKFAKGHSFEVSRFNAYYASRKTNFLCSGGFFNEDGTAYYGGYTAGNVMYRFSITSDPYTFTTLEAGVEIIPRDVLLDRAQRSWITPDGKRMFFAASTSWSGDIYTIDFAKPWPSNSFHGTSTSSSDIYLGDYYPYNLTVANMRKWNGIVGNNNETYWEGFAFSPDGLGMVIVAHSSAGDYVVKFNLSSAFDLSTLEFDSCKKLNDDFGTDKSSWINAVAVNDDGTKMIVFNGRDTGHENKFHEYDLTA